MILIFIVCIAVCARGWCPVDASDVTSALITYCAVARHHCIGDVLITTPPRIALRYQCPTGVSTTDHLIHSYMFYSAESKCVAMLNICSQLRSWTDHASETWDTT